MYNWYVLLIPKTLKFSRLHCKTFVYFALWTEWHTVCWDDFALFVLVHWNWISKSGMQIVTINRTKQVNTKMWMAFNGIFLIYNKNNRVEFKKYTFSFLVALTVTDSHRHSVFTIKRASIVRDGFTIIK